MPAAALPWIGAGVGGAGAIGSSAGGKKAANKANALAQQQLQLQSGQFAKGNKVLGTASDYWSNLLHGGQAAVQATGPYASLIGQAAQGARNSIMATTPRGGEQNLAIAQNYNQASNDIARLYAGMQPLAAQNLASIGGEYLGSAGAPSPYAAAGVYQQQLANAQAGAGGFGSLLYNSLNKLRGGGSSAANPFASSPLLGAS